MLTWFTPFMCGVETDEIDAKPKYGQPNYGQHMARGKRRKAGARQRSHSDSDSNGQRVGSITLVHRHDETLFNQTNADRLCLHGSARLVSQSSTHDNKMLTSKKRDLMEARQAHRAGRFNDDRSDGLHTSKCRKPSALFSCWRFSSSMTYSPKNDARIDMINARARERTQFISVDY
jgi:hypothetical protein